MRTYFLLHFRKKSGACLFCARAYKYRLPVYKKAFADEEAELRITALIIEGRTGMEALLTAITQGEAAPPGSLFS